MRWVLFLAKKYLGSTSKRGIRFVLRLALIGVALGVATLTLTQTVLSGFEKTFRDSILGFNAHLVLLKEGEMKDPKAEERHLLSGQEQKVKALTPFLYREALVIAHGKVKGTVLKGIDPLTFGRVYAVKIRPLDKSQVPANIEDLLNAPRDIPTLVLGADLAEELGVEQPGEKVKVFLPSQETGFHPGEKTFQLFEVTGTFSTGLYEYDHGFAFANLAVLQKLFGVPGVVSGLELKLVDPLIAESLAQEIKAKAGSSYDAVSWEKLNGPLFKALRLERWAFFVIMAMVVAVAAFNIIGVLLLMIFEKSREISILRAMGARYSGLKRLFAIQGLVLGAAGSLMGIGIGCLLAWVLRFTQIMKLAKEVYLVGELPIDVSVGVVVTVVTASLVITYLATQFAISRLNKVPLDL
jgi:lipoprotein-releasing system permease protein